MAQSTFPMEVMPGPENYSFPTTKNSYLKLQDTPLYNYMLGLLKIEVGGQEICPTTFLSPYTCCTQPYVLIPLTLYDFIAFCMK